jgi:Ca-activated chloride channel family protein
LSDGLANHGETNQDALSRHASNLRAKGISTSTFGLGADFDERLMSRLATDGGGHFYFIEQPAQIPDFFTSELGEALEVVARDARLVIAGGAGVEIGCLNEFPVETVPSAAGRGVDIHVRLGDLVSAQQLTVVIAVRCQPRAEGHSATVTLRLADRDTALFPQPMAIEWPATDEAANAAQPVNNEVLIQAAQLLAERARAGALEANRRGDFQQATAILKSAATDLRALAPGVRQVEALAAELEAQQDDFAAVMSAREMKQRHFVNYSRATDRGPEGKAKRSVQSS